MAAKLTSWDKQIEKVIPATFYMISSSSDNQQSEEAHNTSSFELPNPAGKAGGACTSAFLQQQYETGNDQTWVETLNSIKKVLADMDFAQTPMLTSSRPIDKDSPIQLVPPGSGRRRALLIGINYVGQAGELTACHNDCLNLKEYLVECYGFNESEMLILMDDKDPDHRPPTKANIENAMCLLCKYSQPNDVVFVSFSGHGGNISDRSGDEDDGYDETLIPVDFVENGHILDDDILNMLVKPMPAGVTVTVLMDCCHSGTVMDLPYKLSANDTTFQREEKFNMEIVPEPIRSNRGEHSDQPKKYSKKKEPKEPKEDEKHKDLAPNAQLGPKYSPDGQPVLPIRKVADAPGVEPTKDKKQQKEEEDDEEEEDEGEEEEEDDDDDDDEEEEEKPKPAKKGFFGGKKKTDDGTKPEKKKGLFGFFGKKKK